MKKLYILIFLLVPVFCYAQTIYVDINNTTGTEDGTASHPFNTIEEGLANCNNLDTVFIAAGEYNPDSLKIYNNITIIGEGKETTEVNGTFIMSHLLDTLPVGIHNLKCTDIRQVISTPLVISNCLLQTFTNEIGTTDSTAYLKFYDNEVTDSIYIFNAAGNAYHEISNCKSGANLYVEIVSLANQLKIKNCQVGGSLSVRTTACRDTIFVEDNIVNDNILVGSVTAHQRIINGNTIGSYLTVRATSNNYGNQIIGNTVGTGIEVQATASANNIIKNNTIKEGILKCKGVSVTAYIENNIFQNGGIDYKGTAASGSIANNTIYSDGHVPGIKYVAVSAGAPVTNNNIVLPYFEPLKNFEINEIEEVYWDSFYQEYEEDDVYKIADTCAVEIIATAFSGISGNIVQGGAYGICINATSSKISGNTISGCGSGIFASAVRCPVDSNLVSNCTYDGIVINPLYDIDEGEFYPDNDTIGASMSYNVVTNNGGSGILLHKKVNLSYNTLTGNGNYDLYIETPASVNPEIYAQNNLWDHEDWAEIDLYDIYDDDENPEIAGAVFDSIIYHPGIPELLLPLNEASFPDSSQLSFSWKQDVNADSYEFILSSDDLFTDTISVETITDTTFTFSNLEYGKDYFWQVRSLRLGYVSDWSETRSFSTSIPDGIDETLSSSEALKVYPNPVSDKLYIQMPEKTSVFDLRIIDIYGRIIHTQKPFSEKSLDVSGLPAGVYCICLQNRNEMYNARFIKR